MGKSLQRPYAVSPVTAHEAFRAAGERSAARVRRPVGWPRSVGRVAPSPFSGDVAVSRVFSPGDGGVARAGVAHASVGAIAIPIAARDMTPPDLEQEIPRHHARVSATAIGITRAPLGVRRRRRNQKDPQQHNGYEGESNTADHGDLRRAIYYGTW
jgi:hypothetical protein